MYLLCPPPWGRGTIEDGGGGDDFSVGVHSLIHCTPPTTADGGPPPPKGDGQSSSFTDSGSKLKHLLHYLLVEVAYLRIVFQLQDQ